MVYKDLGMHFGTVAKHCFPNGFYISPRVLLLVTKYWKPNGFLVHSETLFSDTTVGVACCAHRYITRGSKVEWGGESERRGKADEGDGVITPPYPAHREDMHIGSACT